MAKIRKGDTVRVMSGKDRGKEGRVLDMYPRQDRILIEGVNVVKRHMRLRAARGRGGQEGGIINQEAPVHVSNVQLVCSSCGPTRVGFRIDDDTKTRICRKCGGEV